MTVPLLIRSALAADAAEIARVHISAIRELCSAAYEARQIAAWLSGKRAENYLDAIAKRPFFVAELDGGVAGFAEIELATGEVRAVYVRPDYGRRGVGARLLYEVEVVARSAALARVHLKASLNSVPFYRAQGYVVDEMTSVPLAGDVQLPCASMHKLLSA